MIGGTGNISTSVSQMLVEKGHELFLLNRDLRRVKIAGARTIQADIHQQDQVQQVLKGMSFDSVVNWIAFSPGDVEKDIKLFQSITDQYVFISSASVYQKPPSHPVITESTPLYNPYWQYSRDKIACEQRLNQAYQEEDLPITIVRPSLTYDTHFPIAIGGWGCYTLADRMLKGKPIIVHGDGASLWTVTHSEDFARGFIGLLGNSQAIGHAFHITSDEILTWNQIYDTIASALGVEANKIHIASDFIAGINPGMGAGLLGDKAWSVLFDNSKIKNFVPGYQAMIPFYEGIRRTLDGFDEDPSRKIVNDSVNSEMDEVINAYLKA